MLAQTLSPAQFGSTRLDGGSLNQGMQRSLSVGAGPTPVAHSAQTSTSAGASTAWRNQGLASLSSQTSGSLFRFGQQGSAGR